jgi:hypothetical protein
VNETAWLLTSGEPSPECCNVAKVLRFFGVDSHIVSPDAFLASLRTQHKGAPKFRLFCSSDAFSGLITSQEASSEETRLWREHVHSAFVYGARHPGLLQKLATTVATEDGAVLAEIDHYAGDFVVSEGLKAFCGAMAGVRVTPSRTGATSFVGRKSGSGTAGSIISTNHGAAFWQTEYQGVAVFLSTSKEIVDLDAEPAGGVFDIRDCVLSALPIVLYVKWAFAATCWNAPEINACLVIDDPLLKSTYGFVDFRQLLTLMKRHRFSTNVAFIPWNWRRSSLDAVRLFRDNPDEFSLSVHGCDHTRAEFGSTERGRLSWKTNQAIERMERHESKTGIHHDRVMVFPQGVFSNTAMSILKRSEFIGAVNNDSISDDSSPRRIKISDLWDVAIMGYENFPIFTRRYPWDGVENFAFDILLGKPCIISIHHDYCGDQCERLVTFVNQLNALNCPITWRGLGDVVRRSCRQRDVRPGVTEVEIYGTEAQVENSSDQPRKFLVKRLESSPSTIREIHAGPRNVNWSASDEDVHFDLEVQARKSVTIRLVFKNFDRDEPWDENAYYKFTTGLRRFLSEARDNYVIKHRLPFVSRFARIN